MNETIKVENRVGEWVVHNGVFESKASKDGLLANRAFTLGDGFFETIRVLNGRVLFWAAHYQRIVAAAQAIHLELPLHCKSEQLNATAQKLIANEGIYQAGRLRITLYREGSGAYLPTDDSAGFIMEVVAMHQNSYTPHNQGVILGNYTELRKDYSPLSAFKMHGSQVYIQAARAAAKAGLDDMVIYNSKGLAIEASASNFFVVMGKALYTPPLTDGCVAGVMRMAVINAAIEAGIPVFEQQMKRELLETADELFLTNTVKGISWVKGFGRKRYTHQVSDYLLQLVLREIEREESNSI